MRQYDRRQLLKTAGVGVGLFGAGHVGAQDASTADNLFELEWESMPEPTVGEVATFEVGMEIFANPLSDADIIDFDVTLELLVGGSVVDSAEPAVDWDGTYVEELEHEFQESGDVDVAVEGELNPDSSLIDPDVEVIETAIEVLPEPDMDLFELDWMSVPEPTVGELAEFEVGIEVIDEPDVLSDADTTDMEVTLELLVDGDVVADAEPAVGWSDSHVEKLEHEFEVSGEVEIAVEGELIPETDILNPDFELLEMILEILPEPIEVSGAAFEIPSFLEEGVLDFLDDIDDKLDIDVPKPLLVADEEQLFLAAIAEEPRDGLVDIEGIGLDVGFDLAGFDLTLGVIATGMGSVEFDESSIDVTLQELSDSPDAYAFERVSVPGDHIAAAVRTRFDIEQESSEIAVNFPTQTGVLVDDAPEIGDMFPSPGTDLFHIVNEPSSANIERVLPEQSTQPGPFVYTGEFDTAFWESAAKEVTGVVIPPETPVAEFVRAEFFPEPDHEARDEIHGIVHAVENPLLYVHEASYSTRDDIDSIADITTASGDLDGDLVTLEVPVGQTTVSVKETLEAAVPCGGVEDWIQLPEACAPVFHDVLLHGGAAWDPEPDDTDDFVGIVGISAMDQDGVAEQRSGVYNVVAEVVDTSRFDEDLPGGVVLAVYDMEHVEALDIVDIVENLIQEIVDILEASITIEDGQDHVPLGPEALPPVENPPQDPDGDGRYEDVDGDGTFDIFDVQMFFENLDSDPVQSNPDAFNFSEDVGDEVTIFDVQALFERLQNWE